MALEMMSRRTMQVTGHVLNLVNVFIGIGSLTSAFALVNGGWLGLLLVPILGASSCYGAYLLQQSIRASDRTVLTYQDLGEIWWNSKGRLIVTTVIYVERIAVLVTHSTSMGVNLASMFPGMKSHNLSSQKYLSVISVCCTLPFVYIRDLRRVSFVSLAGVISTFIILGCVIYTASSGETSFENDTIPALKISKLLSVLGIYSYCFAGQAVIPSLIHSMQDDITGFHTVTIVSFAFTGVLYISFGIFAGFLYGHKAQALITLNLPKGSLVATIAIWSTVVSSFCKFPISIAPIATELEEKVLNTLEVTRSKSTTFFIYVVVRTILIGIILGVSVIVPNFSILISFIGATCVMATSVIFPAAFHLKLVPTHKLPACTILVVGLVIAITGTASAIVYAPS